MWYIYLLNCSDNTLYCGITNDLSKRIETHNKGLGAKYTRGRLPVTLAKSFIVETKGLALKVEYKIKSLPKDKKLSFSLEDYLNELKNH